MLQWKPSLVAAAAVYLAKRNETLDAWVSQRVLWGVGGSDHPN